MAVSVRNAQNVELFTLYEVSKVLGSSLDLQQTLREVLRLLSYHLQMRRGRICLLTEDGKGLRLAAALGMTAEEMERGRFRSGEGIFGRILKTGMPAVVPNLAEEPLYLDRTRSRIDDMGEVVVSLVGVPIKAGGDVVGVLTIDRISDEGPAARFDSDVRLLTMVANLIGQVVRLHHTLAEERRVVMQDSHRRQKAMEPAAEIPKIEDVVFTSRRMHDVLAQVHRVAPFRSTVLIRGESGTGKELIARAIHTLSPRKSQPFVRINCAALPETLLESELFGYDKGAFTGATRDHKGRFELASGGTLFLDEIGDISASFQAKLLRVLQEQEFERVGGNRTIKTDVRIIAATNVNLEEAVAQGRFRADLYYRINVVSIFLPPLRERKEDVIPLSRHFIAKFNQDNGMSVAFEPQALSALERCPWPGNVRELENCIERAATQAREGVIREADLSCRKDLCFSSTLWQYRAASSPGGVPSGIPAGLSAALPSAAPAPSCASNCAAASAPMVPLPEPLLPARPAPLAEVPRASATDDLDPANPRDRLIIAMERAGWVQAKAARILGLSVRQVGYALKKYDIEVKKI